MAKNPFEDMVSPDSPPIPQSSNPFDELALQEKNTMHPVRAVAQQTGRKFLAHAIASPRSAVEILSSLGHLAAQKGVEQEIKSGETPQEDKFTENVLKVVDFPKYLLEKFWPNAESAERGIKKVAEFLGAEQTPIEPQTPGQERGANIGAFAGSSILGGPKKLLERLVLGTIAGIGSQIGKEAIGSTEGELAGSLALPAFLSLVYQIKKGKWSPNDKQLNALKSVGESLGLTAEEITPIVQSEAKIATLGRVATATSKSTRALESAEMKLGQAYETLKSDAKAFPGLSSQSRSKMLTAFDDIVTNLKKSALPPDEKIKVINKIESAINHFAANGVDAQSIIETWQDVNKTVNWHAYAGGKKDLAALKAPLKEALNEIDPTLANRFEDINALWGKMKNIGSKITDKEMKKWVDYGEAYALLGSVTNAVFTGNWGPVKAAVGTVAARRLANKMLTDPKYQDLYRRSVNAIRSSSKAEGLKVLKELDLEADQPENEKNNK
jgi:hypothetical protein